MAISRLLSSRNSTVQPQVRMYKRSYDAVIIPGPGNYYTPDIIGYAGRGTLIIHVHADDAMTVIVNQGEDCIVAVLAGAGSYFIAVPVIADNIRGNFYNAGGAPITLAGSIAVVPGLAAFTFAVLD